MDFPTLRTAGDGLSNIPGRVMDAVRGLRMPGTKPGGTPLPTIDPSMAAPAAPAPTPAAPAAPSTPLPTIDPTMAPQSMRQPSGAPVTAPQTAAPASMRINPIPAAAQTNIPPTGDFLKAPSAPEVPMSARVPLPQIPTLTDVIKPGNVPMPSTTIPPTNDFLKVRSAAPLPGAPAAPGIAGSSAPGAAPILEAPGGGGMRMPSGYEGWGRAAGSLASKAGWTNRGAALPGLAAASSFAPHWDAFGGDWNDNVGMKAKLLLRDSARAGMGLMGGVAGAAVGGALGSAAGPVGTVAGGLAGGIGLGTAAYNAMDDVSGTIRQGLNWANEKLGGSPNYITSTDEDLRKAGFDPNRSVVDMVRGEMGVKPANAATPATGKPGAPGTPGSNPAVPADVAAFNARVQSTDPETGMGAPTMSMRAMTPTEIARANATPGFSGGQSGGGDSPSSPAGGPQAAAIAGLYQARAAAASSNNAAEVARIDAQINKTATAANGPQVQGMSDSGPDPLGGSIGMRADANSRVLFNNAPASEAAKNATAQNMMNRTNQLSDAEAGYARAEAGRQADLKMQQIADSQFQHTPQGMQFANEMDQAHQARIGASPVGTPQQLMARQALAQQNFEATKNARLQGSVMMRGQDVTSEDARLQQQTALLNGMRSQTNINFQHQLEATKENRAAQGDAFTQGQAAEDHVSKALDSRFTTGTDSKGQPVVDTAGKNAALAGIERSAALMSPDGVRGLSSLDRERLMAGSELSDKVNKDASNILPWKPNFTGTVLPHDLIGMQKDGSDYVIPRGAAKGNRIPARYLDKVNADHFGGQPTNTYDVLKAQ